MKSYFSFSNPYFNYYYSHSKKQKEEYYYQFINEESLSAIFNLFNTASHTVLITDTTIGVGELPFGSSTFKVLLKKGIPDYKKAKKYGKIKYEVRAYRSNFYKCTLQTNLHFINNKLLYVHHSFLYVDIELQKMIYQLLEEKYQCPLAAYPEFDIKDSFGNCLKVNLGMHLNLYYLNGNKNYLQLLKDELNRKEFLKEKSSLYRRNSINKLI